MCIDSLAKINLIKDSILLPSITRLYQIDYDNIRFDVSERNVCARLAHHMENLMREYDQQNNNNPFIGYYADVEYNRMGNGDIKHFENSEHRPQNMVSDLLIQSRGYERNLLALEMKKVKASKKDKDNDRERLRSLVSPSNGNMEIRCVHDTLLGVFMIYSLDEVTLEFYENDNDNRNGRMSEIWRLSIAQEFDPETERMIGSIHIVVREENYNTNSTECHECRE